MKLQIKVNSKTITNPIIKTVVLVISSLWVVCALVLVMLAILPLIWLFSSLLLMLALIMIFALFKPPQAK